MLNRIKSLFFRLGWGERRSLQRHDEILQEMDETQIRAKRTIEEHFRLRGFPYSRSLERARG